MMTLYARRERFERMSLRVGTLFSKAGLSPNQWTLLSLVPALAALFFLVRQQFIPAAGLFLLSGFLDVVDGAVARVTGRTSLLGAYLDTIADRYKEGIIVFGLLFVGLPTLLMPAAGWITLYLFGALMTTYAKAAAKEKGLVEKELKGGILELAERLFILFLALLLAEVSTLYTLSIIATLAILANISALQRIAKAVRMAAPPAGAKQ